MFVDNFFAILNFGVLVGLFVALFFKMFRPQIVEKLKEQDRVTLEREELRHQCTRLLGDIERDRESREEQYRSLARKVAEWKRISAEAERQVLQDQKIREAFLRQRYEKQTQNFIIQRRWAQVVPQAVAQARLELYDHFQEGEVGACCIDRIVTSVKRGHGNR